MTDIAARNRQIKNTLEMVPEFKGNYIHAAKVCADLEAGLTAAAARAQMAIREAQAELQLMLDILNDGRAARGLPPLDVTMEAVQ